MHLFMMGARTFSLTVLAVVGAGAAVAGATAGFVGSRVSDSDDVKKVRDSKAEKAKGEKADAKAKAAKKSPKKKAPAKKADAKA